MDLTNGFSRRFLNITSSSWIISQDTLGFIHLKQKSQVFDVFTKIRSLVENQFQFKLKTLCSDNGGEYIGLLHFLATHGISHFTTPPHTPDHNGLAERRHRHRVETGLSLLSHASMPRSYWTYAFAAAVYLINRIPTQVLQLTSTFQKLFSRNPNFEKMKVFGCLCFPWLRPYTSNKLDDRSTPCVFLGYSITQSAYFCLDRSTSRIYTSRHVLFHETVFPFSFSGSLTTPGSGLVEDVSVTTSSLTHTQIYRQPQAPTAQPPEVTHNENTATTVPSAAQ